MNETEQEQLDERKERTMHEDKIDTLGDALPREIARVRDEVLPEYIKIGPAGAFAAHMMRMSMDAASKAMIEGDCIAMIAAYNDLKGYEV